MNQRGEQGNYPPDRGWGIEISLDLDAVSAACPLCHILLVEADSASTADLGASVDEAVALGAKYVSNSYGTNGEYEGETDTDHYFNHPGVAVTVSSGDNANIVNSVAANPNVIAVGGTRLTRDDSTARGWTEAVCDWGHDDCEASPTGPRSNAGSGCSLYESKPDYQDGVDTNCDMRATADISADADPHSGLAVYDSHDGHEWVKVGGTSLSAPLVAGMYALAGTPAEGTYPVTYPYEAAGSGLFDITQGKPNGDCGTVLCSPGPGWDGPTGLGTPNGVDALRSGPHGSLTGTIADTDTGHPLAGVTVTVEPGHYVISTGADGGYTLDSVGTGSYDVTAHKYGYADVTQTGVQVSKDQTTTVDFTLDPVSSSTVSGTVTDGSGHGWPLYARIDIDGYPNGPIYTDPVTGHYSVVLVQGSYTLHVAPTLPGYQAADVQVAVGADDVQHDVRVAVDSSACVAPGYGWDGLTEQFTGWTGSTARYGWTVAGHGDVWAFDDPTGRTPPPGGSGQFAVAGSATNASRVHTLLVSPTVDLSDQASPVLEFDTAYYAGGRGQSAQVDLRIDGHRWISVWRQATRNAIVHVQLPIPQAGGHQRVRVRFDYTGRHGWWWAVDNVLVGTHRCTPVSGGLLAGLVTETGTGAGVVGAHVVNTANPQQSRWPAGYSAATSTDANLPDGYYWLFTPSGDQELTVTAEGYQDARASVQVDADQVTRHDWALDRADGGGG